VMACSDSGNAGDDQPGMTDVVTEDRGKRYLRPGFVAE
jgi:hypothetical protein